MDNVIRDNHITSSVAGIWLPPQGAVHLGTARIIAGGGGGTGGRRVTRAERLRRFVLRRLRRAGRTR